MYGGPNLWCLVLLGIDTLRLGEKTRRLEVRGQVAGVGIDDPRLKRRWFRISLEQRKMR